MTGANLLNRRAVVAALLVDRGDMLVVAGLGAPANDVTAVGDHPLNFPLWGAMGSAGMIGLGLALAQPTRPVLVITGDGEMLMGLGSLATIAVQRPPNLAIAVLDNERYGETGSQMTHTAHGVDLATVARGCGFAAADVVRDMDGVAALQRCLRGGGGPRFGQIKIAPDREAMILPPRDGSLLKTRFREALLGPRSGLL
jgi:thiamine pyrophosphate-dependent acetolactate synthase large subunit-like protein